MTRLGRGRRKEPHCGGEQARSLAPDPLAGLTREDPTMYETDRGRGRGALSEVSSRHGCRARQAIKPRALTKLCAIDTQLISCRGRVINHSSKRRVAQCTACVCLQRMSFSLVELINVLLSLSPVFVVNRIDFSFSLK